MDIINSYGDGDNCSSNRNNVQNRSNVQVICDASEQGDDFSMESLLYQTVESEEKAFELYNSYAWNHGFGIRLERDRKRSRDGKRYYRKLVCCKQGEKRATDKINQMYTKLDSRCGCLAYIVFKLRDDGLWEVTEHFRRHNHVMCPENERHLLRSHRNVSKGSVEFFKTMKSAGITVGDSYKVLARESGGPSKVGFTSKDAYNQMEFEKRRFLDGSDSNSLIETLRYRASHEEDFFFDFELDAESSLRNIFWRDGQMKLDYSLFGDLVVHDTTYRTNKYDMICGPFVGVDNHNRNVMFGIGFLRDEKYESFVWLFSAFLRSMDNKQPTTIMTDQSASMAKAIPEVFPTSRHRLCIWHIIKNSEKNVGYLRQRIGFSEMLYKLLTQVETVAEFEWSWNNMMETYGCRDVVWLKGLYDIREKWCPAFNKAYFSGGTLSSQRSETTNRSISLKLSKTSTLCEFYGHYVDVVNDWRYNAAKEDHRCFYGKVAVAVKDSLILNHACEVYTIEMYTEFENQYMQMLALNLVQISQSNGLYEFQVWVPKKNNFRHVVLFDENSYTVNCTCKMFTEVGILCCHCLRVLMQNNYQRIPAVYILNRWTKSASISRNEKINISQEYKCSGNPSPSLWRADTSRKYLELIKLSHTNEIARRILDEYFVKARDAIAAEAELVDENLDIASSKRIRDPSSRRAKGVRNVRIKSTVEKRINKSKAKHQGRSRKSEAAALRSNKVVNDILKKTYDNLDGVFVNPVDD